MATLALGLAATGCSGSSQAVPTGPDIYKATISAGTAHLWVDLNVDAPRASTFILAEGDTDLATGATALSVQDAGLSTNELLAGNVVYFQVPVGARRANGGKAWAEVELGSGPKTGPGSAQGSAPGSALTELAPTPLVDVLALRPKSSSFVGKSKVGGKLASEYRFEFPTASLVGRGAAGDGQAQRGLISLIAGLPHPSRATFPIYVWLDREGRAVQLAASATLETEPTAPTALQASLANQLPATVSVRVNLGDFGERAKLAPPPAREVERAPLSQLQAGIL